MCLCSVIIFVNQYLEHGVQFDQWLAAAIPRVEFASFLNPNQQSSKHFTTSLYIFVLSTSAGPQPVYQFTNLHFYSTKTPLQESEQTTSLDLVNRSHPAWLRIHTWTSTRKYDHYDFPTTSPEAQSGHPGHTTREQDAAVHQLRAMLEQAGYKERLDTLTMLRFLRARKFNVEMSKQM